MDDSAPHHADNRDPAALRAAATTEAAAAVYLANIAALQSGHPDTEERAPLNQDRAEQHAATAVRFCRMADAAEDLAADMSPARDGSESNEGTRATEATLATDGPPDATPLASDPEMTARTLLDAPGAPNPGALAAAA